mmetsp:Transcript_35329/g.113802  ORF Transcript_35329/g.113802 Transcript_35329/m.113802 type:complete len:373 (+) Transcript_35329:1065-2183(+)
MGHTQPVVDAWRRPGCHVGAPHLHLPAGPVVHRAGAALAARRVRGHAVVRPAQRAGHRLLPAPDWRRPGARRARQLRDGLRGGRSIRSFLGIFGRSAAGGLEVRVDIKGGGGDAVAPRVRHARAAGLRRRRLRAAQGQGCADGAHRRQGQGRHRAVVALSGRAALPIRRRLHPRHARGRAGHAVWVPARLAQGNRIRLHPTGPRRPLCGRRDAMLGPLAARRAAHRRSPARSPAPEARRPTGPLNRTEAPGSPLGAAASGGSHPRRGPRGRRASLRAAGERGHVSLRAGRPGLCCTHGRLCGWPHIFPPPGAGRCGRSVPHIWRVPARRHRRGRGGLRAACGRGRWPAGRGAGTEGRRGEVKRRRRPVWSCG